MQMNDDIVPELLKAIEKDFDRGASQSETLKRLFKLLEDKKATYIDVNDFAVEIGRILSKALGSNISVAKLPDGRMYFNIADRVLNATLQKNYDLISNFAADVQTELNRQAGLRLKAQFPGLSQDRIDGIINRFASEEDFEKIKWLLDEPIVTFSQSIVDEIIKANVDFQAKAGLQAKITRKVVGKACKWCRDLAGIYDYHELPDDIYRRHERCRCTVDYNPGDGRRQNVWSKVWKDPERERKIEERKKMNLKGKE